MSSLRWRRVSARVFYSSRWNLNKIGNKIGVRLANFPA
jgi:hypothetical protein